MISIGLISSPLPAIAWVHSAKASTTRPVTGADRRAIATARPRTSPVVFMARKVAPCVTQMASSVTAVKIPYGWSRVQNEPVYSCGSVDRQAVQQIAERHADQHRHEHAADRQRRAPAAQPGRAVPLAAVLERDAACHQRAEQHDQGQVQAGEHGRVPAGEGGEHRRPGDDQPDLVAVPQRPDRVDRRAAAGLGPADHAVQDPDPEVEAFQDEEPGPDEAISRNQNETKRHPIPLVQHRRHPGLGIDRGGRWRRSRGRE